VANTFAAKDKLIQHRRN